MDVLKDLFDEKVVEIILLLIDNPNKTFSLSDISNATNVNVATTFRIVNRLITKEFIKISTIGKVKFYTMADNEKTKALKKLLKRDAGPLQKFTEEIGKFPEIKKIILESKENEVAKLLIIEDAKITDKLNKIKDKIKEKYKFTINFIELSEEQYEGFKSFKNYDLEKKIIWDREEEL